MWKWVLVGAGVLYIVMEREKQSVKIAANKAGTDATNAAGRGVVTVIDEAASAVGRWFGGLFNDKPTNSGSSTGSSAASSPDYWDDLYDYGDV
jgi:KaiC/GvpD/RAD55 family RecA-like ATPase